MLKYLLDTLDSFFFPLNILNMLLRFLLVLKSLMIISFPLPHESLLTRWPKAFFFSFNLKFCNFIKRILMLIILGWYSQGPCVHFQYVLALVVFFLILGQLPGIIIFNISFYCFSFLFHESLSFHLDLFNFRFVRHPIASLFILSRSATGHVTTTYVFVVLGESCHLVLL